MACVIRTLHIKFGTDIYYARRKRRRAHTASAQPHSPLLAFRPVFVFLFFAPAGGLLPKICTATTAACHVNSDVPATCRNKQGGRVLVLVCTVRAPRHCSARDALQRHCIPSFLSKVNKARAREGSHIPEHGLRWQRLAHSHSLLLASGYLVQAHTRHTTHGTRHTAR